MTDKLDGLSMDIEAENKARLASVFPECFTEGKLDIDKLLSLCGEYITDDFEKYEFKWKGKSECLRLAQRRSTATLRPCPSESVHFDTTQNLYIEGDNLEVLKLLQKSYFRKVKMIYIDPPYNTGNDFVYEDDFSDPMRRYVEVTQQTTKSNPETMGRYHTNWLNMMYPRLRLAANLLRDDGVIFISIDDGEQSNMRKLCDEVFGEENFMAQIIWQKVYSPRMDVQGFSTSHDYVLCYVKSNVESIRQEAFTQNAAQFNFTDPANGKKYRRRSIRKEGSHSTRSERPNLWFALPAPDGTEVYPYKPDGTEGCWRWSMETYKENEQKGIVEWVRTENGWQAYAKQYLDTDALKPPETLWLHQEVGHNHAAAEELKKLLDGKVFDSPKPKELIIKMLKLATYPDSSDIILDFFSGSATTAHAVMQLNAEDGGNRRYICVQLPELCDEKSEAFKAGYPNICEIGKERIRRAGAKILEEVKQKNNQLKLGEEPKPLPDAGFKVFKLDSSNLKIWDDTPIEDGDIATLFDRIDGHIDGLKPDRSDEDLIYEILLKMGYPLTAGLATADIGGLTVYKVSNGEMLVCLQEGITAEHIEQMAALSPQKIVLAGRGLADSSAKANAFYLLENRGIELKTI
ncbi:MAG: site-specific DNA-methyltransferase [Oscillospiraceae bacterium]|nr:MAG: site-specific DNA-methyltransferase [Oscillospiraceae bacterium]